MADIDTISKYLIQHYPDHFANFALAREDVEVIEVIETEQLTVEARQADSFIRVRIGDEEALVHNEFQTTDSTNPPITPLMKPPEGMASDAWLHQCIHTAQTSRIERTRKSNYLACMATLSELVYESETISEIIIKEGIMDLIRESSLIQYFKREGIEEGIEQGIEQGGRQRAIEDLLDVLEIRFDMPETHPLSTHIAAIDDLQRLKQLHRAAIQVPNLEAFQRMLDA